MFRFRCRSVTNDWHRDVAAGGGAEMRGYGGFSQGLAVITILLGVAILVSTAVHGGGEVGIVIGVLFLALGGGRLFLARRT